MGNVAGIQTQGMYVMVPSSVLTNVSNSYLSIMCFKNPWWNTLVRIWFRLDAFKSDQISIFKYQYLCVFWQFKLIKNSIHEFKRMLEEHTVIQIYFKEYKSMYNNKKLRSAALMYFGVQLFWNHIFGCWSSELEFLAALHLAWTFTTTKILKNLKILEIEGHRV